MRLESFDFLLFSFICSLSLGPNIPIIAYGCEVIFARIQVVITFCLPLLLLVVVPRTQPISCLIQ